MIRALFALLLLFGLAACSDRDERVPLAPPKPALWSVEDARGSTAGWLFGTIHALPDGIAWETPALTRAIEDAGVLVVEVRDLDPQRIGASLKRLATDEAVPPLAQRLPAGLRDDLADLLDRTGTRPHAYDGLETWAAALALARAGSAATSANGVDTAIVARFGRRAVEELEGAERQLEIFDALPEADQRRLLAAVLAEQANPDADVKELAMAWLAGDLDTLERTTRRGLLADPALYRALSVDRNRAWTARLGPMFANGRRPLVAVGTAHMLGPDGLPALLAAQGYRVRRIQ